MDVLTLYEVQLLTLEVFYFDQTLLPSTFHPLDLAHITDRVHSTVFSAQDWSSMV